MIYSMLLICVIFCLGLIYIKRKQNYWQRHGIPFIKPISLFGYMKSTNRKEHLSHTVTSIYQKYIGNTPIVGLYFFVNPAVVVVDLDLIRNILIADFQHFQDRGLFYNEKDEPLSANLLRIEYDKWRPLRLKLSPTFTPGKMKFMFPTMMAVANELVDCMSRSIQTDSEIEVYEWMGRFTTDIIGTCAFGIECNSLRDSQAIIYRMCKKVFADPQSSILEQILMRCFANVAKFIRLRVFRKDMTEFFLNIVKETVAHRELNQVERNDFMELLIGLKNSKNDLEKLTINEIAAQAMAFFVAGFETSSTALTCCLYELAMDNHKHIQNQARNEIRSVLEKHNGHLSYEALNEMTYVDQIINETLRKYPPTSGALLRVATKDYKIPNTNFTIPEGMPVLIPTYAVHHDPNIYEEPDKFEPNRFSPEQINMRPSCSFLALGNGPRNCIALRFGMLQVRIGLVKLLQNFEFSTCPRTDIPIKYSSKSIILQPEDGTWLKVNTIL